MNNTETFVRYFGEKQCRQLDDDGSVTTTLTVRSENTPFEWPFKMKSFDVIVTLNFGKTLSYLWPWDEHIVFDEQTTNEIIDDEAIYAMTIECLPEPPTTMMVK